MASTSATYGPLLDPPFNPFLKWHNITTASKATVWQPEDYLTAHKIATKIEDMSKKSFRSLGSMHTPYTMKDTHLLQPGEHAIYKEADRRRCAAGAMFVFGKVTDAIVEPFIGILPSQNTFDREGLEDMMAKYSGSVQRLTLTFLKDAVTELVEVTGGETAWKAADDADIQALLSDVFNEHPLTICKHTFHYENETVDFGKIWASKCANASEWQDICRKKFVLLSLATWKLRFSKVRKWDEAKRRWIEKAGRKDLKALCEVWDGHMAEGELCELVKAVGGVKELPARPFREAGSGRDDTVARWFKRGTLRVFEDMESWSMLM